MNNYFKKIYEIVEQTEIAQEMKNTVEDSPWHRERNTWVHTQMCIDFYQNNIAEKRTEKQQLITLIALLGHDFGKPEAEEELEKADGSGKYRRYAGHEKISANTFVCLFKDTKEIQSLFFEAGLIMEDLRTIKWMIEQHLPYAISRTEKVSALKAALNATLNENVECFYDMLRSDANGRISDNHAEKLENVEVWIENFKGFEIRETKKPQKNGKTLYVLHGASGCGKSTFAEQSIDDNTIIASEDAWRLEYAEMMLPEMKHSKNEKEWYDFAWQLCHTTKDSAYDLFASEKYKEALNSGKDIILDRTNQTRKNRAKWLNVARSIGFKIISIEFFMSVNESMARQNTRGDKFINSKIVSNIIMNMETPWLGIEVDEFMIVPI